ncbi:MAG: hypothetical protein INR72_13280 [Williamsia herbipolensis]|nr:hypothetical protein [Williamsia herbipolensis]
MTDESLHAPAPQEGALHDSARRIASTAPHVPVLVRAPGERFEVPASAAQQRMWFASQVAADAALYHVYEELPLQPPTDPGPEPVHAVLLRLLADAWGTIVQRHESLRTTIHRDAQELVQRIHTQLDSRISFWDLLPEPTADRMDILRVLIRELLSTPLDLERPPPWELALVRIDDDDWRLVVSIHHAVADGASLLTIRGELSELMAAANTGRSASLPEIPLQYVDYSEWQRTGMDDSLADLDRFWDGYLAELPAVHTVPLDRPRPPERTFAAQDVDRRVDEAQVAAMSQFAADRRCSEFMVLCAAFLGVLARWSDSTDLVVGLPVTGRDRPELDRVIGMFVNMVVLRVDADSDPTFDELLDRTRSAVLDVLEHQQMPFQRLVHRHATRAGQAVPPLYQIGFNHLAQRQRINVSSAEDDLGCEIGFDEFGRFGIRVEYNTALFEESTALAMADDLVDTMIRVCADPSVRLSQLAIRRPFHRPAPAVTADPPVPDPATSTDPSAPEPVAAQTLSPTEQLVADTWRELLPQAGAQLQADDDFFDCGGHSLLALRVIARLREAAGVDLQIADFFADTTVRGVGAAVERALIEQIAGLSDEQTRQVLDDGPGATTPPPATRSDGPLQPATDPAADTGSTR